MPFSDRLGLMKLCFSHRSSFEFELVGVVDEAVENRVGEGWVANPVVSFFDRELAGDQGGTGGVSVLEEFEQVAAMVSVELGEAEVVKDDEVELGERGEQLGIGSVAAGDGNVVQQPREAQVQRGESVAAGLMGERAGEPGLADAARSGDEDVEVLAQPAPGGEGEDEGLVESAGVAEIDVLEAGVGMAQLRAAQSIGQSPATERRFGPGSRSSSTHTGLCPTSIVVPSSLVLIRGVLLKSDRLTILSARQTRYEVARRTLRFCLHRTSDRIRHQSGCGWGQT